MRRLLLAALLLVALPAVAATPPQWIRYDSRHFGVFFVEAEARSALALAENAEELRARVVRELGADFDAKILVYLAPDRETYEALQPGRKPPSWSVGVAHSSERTILLFSPTGALREGLHGDTATTFMHETAHIALHEIVGGRRVPRWLNEGVAQMIAREWSTDDAFRLTVGALFDGLIPLDDLMRGWPETASRAKLAYAQSLSLAIYLKEKRQLKPLLAAIAGGQAPRRALRTVTGQSLPQFEKRWRRYLERRQTWLVVLNRSCIWGGMALLAILAGVIVLIRRRRKYETLDDPAYRDPRLDPPTKLRRLRSVERKNRWPGPH